MKAWGEANEDRTREITFSVDGREYTDIDAREPLDDVDEDGGDR